METIVNIDGQNLRALVMTDELKKIFDEKMKWQEPKNIGVFKSGPHKTNGFHQPNNK
jgi:hypothetical protein